MPQLGQLGALMAVIASCFTILSLIHLTVCLPPCCNPSILIKSELNDQWCLCAGDHHFSMLLRRNLRRAQATKPSRARLLSAVNADLCSKATIYDVFKDGNPLLIDFLCSGSHVQGTSGGSGRLIEEAFKRDQNIKLCAEHQYLLCWVPLLEWGVRHYCMKAEKFCKTNGVKCFFSKNINQFLCCRAFALMPTNYS